MLAGEARAPEGIVMAPLYWFAWGKRISDRVDWHGTAFAFAPRLPSEPCVSRTLYGQLVARGSWAQCGHRHIRCWSHLHDRPNRETVPHSF